MHLASAFRIKSSYRTLLVSSTVRSRMKIGEFDSSRTPDSRGKSAKCPNVFTMTADRAVALAAALNNLWQRVESSCINKSRFLSNRDRSWCFARYMPTAQPKSIPTVVAFGVSALTGGQTNPSRLLRMSRTVLTDVVRSLATGIPMSSAEKVGTAPTNHLSIELATKPDDR